MKTYDEILAPLDKKWGRPVTLQDWAALGNKAVVDLTDDDLTVVLAFEGPAAWRQKQDARDRWLTPAPPSTPVTVPSLEQLGESPAATPEPTVLNDGSTWETLLATYGDQPMTYQDAGTLVDVVMDAWKAMNERNKERNAKIAALEARVLELEARNAEREAVPHVDR